MVQEQFFLGISSGVLCVIFGIYDKLVESVFGIFKDFKKNFYYLLPIALGGFTGIFLLGNILKHLLTNFPIQTKYAFIGLILGSIPILIKKVNSQKSFRLHYFLYTLLAFFIGIGMIFLEKYMSSHIFTSYSLTDNLLLTVNSISPSFFLLLMIAGFFMSIGIVVPGVSSTVILMCFGIYEIYLSAIATFNLSFLIPLGIGVILGGILFLKMIQFLLNHYYMQTFYAIIGFSIGSIFVLYTPISFDFTGLLSILLLVSFFQLAKKLESKGNE